MDGGGRLLRSLGGFGTQLAPATYALAAPGAAYAPLSYDDVAPRLPQRRWLAATPPSPPCSHPDRRDALPSAPPWR